MFPLKIEMDFNVRGRRIEQLAQDFLCFTALQGESFELENVPSDFKTCRVFY